MAQEQIPTELIQHLQKLWSIESQLTEAMPRMIEKAGSVGLEKTLAFHFEETRQHKTAIEAICKQLSVDAKGGEPDSGLRQILQEGENNMMNTNGKGLDVIIIEGAEKIEEYEIEAYTLAGEAAMAAGLEGVAKRLYLTMEEERQARTKLKFLQKSLYSNTSDIGELANENAIHLH